MRNNKTQGSVNKSQMEKTHKMELERKEIDWNKTKLEEYKTK